MKTKLVAVIIIISFALACGGGGGSDTGITSEEQPLTNESELSPDDMVFLADTYGSQDNLVVTTDPEPSVSLPTVNWEKPEIFDVSGNMFSEGTFEGYADINFSVSGDVFSVTVSLTRNGGNVYTSFVRSNERGYTYEKYLPAGNYSGDITASGAGGESVVSGNFYRHPLNEYRDDEGTTLTYEEEDTGTGVTIEFETEDFPGVIPASQRKRK